MRRLALLILSLFAFALPAAADEIVVIEEVTEIVEVGNDGGSERLVGVAPAVIPLGIASFGPFRVLDGSRAALVGVTDSRSPAQFAAMLAAYPGITMLEMIEAPGTEDDRANLKLGRMIRARGITTYVPAGGSVRSGGVELFLAGTRRIADPGAEFAVHAWADEDGREANDYPADAPENRAYVDYYVEMGLPPPQARAFYAMTNSVPHADARWLTAQDMGQWVRLD
ncbi:MAG: alpha/beta hydrolase [Sphingomonadaceae bacterium]|nr:alpha/beta hydrolase [Sphingomonadaceae bacterium]